MSSEKIFLIEKYERENQGREYLQDKQLVFVKAALAAEVLRSCSNYIAQEQYCVSRPLATF